MITDFGSPGKKLDLKMQLHPSSTLESKAAIVQGDRIHNVFLI